MATFYIEAIDQIISIGIKKTGTPTIGEIHYGVNDPTVPNTYTVSSSTQYVVVNPGEKCYWTISSTSEMYYANRHIYFSSSPGRAIKVGGNLSDLIGGESVTPRDGCFAYLFKQQTGLIDASELILVSPSSTTGAEYECMFTGCTGLVNPPAIPDVVSPSTYFGMFYGCTSLVHPPALPATTIKYRCYEEMFYGCTSLTEAPVLPAMTVFEESYNSMFEGCTSLTEAPELPATTIAAKCYYSMFYGCTGLTVPPRLPATTLYTDSYTCMFKGCTGIKLSTVRTAEYVSEYRIPSSGTGTTAGTDCLWGMFNETGGSWVGTPDINTVYYGMWETTYVISATAEHGTVTGTGTYAEGATATLTATPDEDYSFINWTENGVVVSTSSTYVFNVSSDRTLVANFVSNIKHVRLKDGNEVLYPQTKCNNVTDLPVSNLVVKSISGGLVYTTTAPTSINEDGVRIAVLTSEPATKYAGWLYIITEV